MARPINPLLWKGLLGSLVLSAGALWWPGANAPLLSDVARVATPQDVTAVALAKADAAMAPTAAAPAALPVPLPDELPPPRFEKPAFDPFVGVVPAALKPLPVAAPLPVATVLPPPPPPAAPALNYRYLGQMVSPAGVKTVYLARADVMVPVSTGTLLEEGYVVEAIDGEGVRLHYPPMKLHALIALPPPENPSR